MTQIKTEGKNYLGKGRSLCQGAMIGGKTTAKVAAQPQKAAGNVVEGRPEGLEGQILHRHVGSAKDFWLCSRINEKL